MPDSEVSKAARTLSKLGASKGGVARAKRMTPEERKEVAQKAANTRWGVPRATHTGEIHIGNTSIPCAVLEDGTRLLTQEGFLKAIGRSGKPASGRGSSVEKIAPFLALDNLKPFIDTELASSTFPVIFQTVTGAKAYGYKAELLPKVCEVYLRARDAGVLLKSQLRFAQACDILIRGLAHIGIVALVDEATGYQADRDREELHKILEAYISKELLPWAKRFPDEFYEQMFRLRGWQYHPMTKRGPRKAGELTSQIVYEKLPPGILEELRSRNPVIRERRRRHRHHQLLTDDIGHEHLKNHLIGVTTLMRAATTWKEFESSLARAFPSHHKSAQIEMTFDGTGSYTLAADRREEDRKEA